MLTGLFSAFYHGAAANSQPQHGCRASVAQSNQIEIVAIRGKKGKRLNIRGLKCIAIKA
jgi:hypothetical protein